MNEKNPFDSAASSMNKSSGTLAAECAPIPNKATPIPENIYVPAEDKKNIINADKPVMPNIFSLEDTSRSPIFKGS
jgi:hypothetical protein